MTLKLMLLAGALAALAGSASAAEDGASLFAQNCAACHQAKGEGIQGAFPALAGNKLVVGDPKTPAWIITHGRGGMPNFAEDLNDEQVATILTFLRSTWGNSAPAVDVATVAGVRSAAAPPDSSAGLPFH